MHDNDPTPQDTPGESSLLEGIEQPTEPAAGATRKRRLPRLGSMTVGELLSKRSFHVGVGIVALVLLGIGISSWVGKRHQPPPDFVGTRLDTVLDYALLSGDFNALPLQERLELLQDLIERMKNMSSEDSVFLAAFAAQIEGEIREQLEENVARLVVDVWDEHSLDYSRVPPEGREEYLEDVFVEMSEMLEGLAGETRDVTPEERIQEVRRQADRDIERQREGRGANARQLGRLTAFLEEGIGDHATPQERVRGQAMLRDMTRMLRGQDPLTGEPLPEPTATPDQ